MQWLRLKTKVEVISLDRAYDLPAVNENYIRRYLFVFILLSSVKYFVPPKNYGVLYLCQIFSDGTYLLCRCKLSHDQKLTEEYSNIIQI